MSVHWPVFSLPVNRKHPESLSKWNFILMWVCAVNIYCQSFNLNTSVENHGKLNRNKNSIKLVFPMLLLLLLLWLTPHWTFYHYAKCTIPLPHSSYPFPLPTYSTDMYLLFITCVPYWINSLTPRTTLFIYRLFDRFCLLVFCKTNV